MAITEITPTIVKINKLIHRIEAGEIKIPAFQRGFVWTQEQVIELLDSIYNDYPVGSILLWNSLEKLKASRNIGGFQLPSRQSDYPVDYVLDGQQRLSTLYAVFCQDRTQATDDNDYNVELSIFDIYFDLDDEKFVPSREKNGAHENLVLNSLFDFKALLKEMERFSDRGKTTAESLLSRFHNYEIPVVTISKRGKNEVGTIFERINSTGTRLTTLDLMVAWTWSDNFHLREEIRELLETLDIKSFGDLPEKIILQALSGIIKQDTKTKAILELPPIEVRDNFTRLGESLAKAIDFISTEFNITTGAFLPHTHQIVPLAYFFSLINTPSNRQCKAIRQWFWKTSFSRRYSAQTDDKMNDDIVFFGELAQGNDSGIAKYSYTINPSTLIEQTFSKSHPFVRAYLLLLAQKVPRNLVNGSKVDLGEALSKYNRKEYHHVFPKAFLKNNNVDNNRINSLCNFCFLPADSNKIILNKEPAYYFFHIVPQDDWSNILESNLLQLDKSIYSSNDYDRFLNERAALIMQFLDQQLM